MWRSTGSNNTKINNCSKLFGLEEYELILENLVVLHSSTTLVQRGFSMDLYGILIAYSQVMIALNFFYYSNLANRSVSLLSFKSGMFVPEFSIL